MKLRLLVFLLFVGASACTPTTSPAPTPIPTLPPERLVLRWATVEVPPTLDPLAAAATRRAELPTPTMTLPPTSTPTPYIGIFIGGGAGGNDIPDIDGGQYAGTLAASAPLTFPTLGSPCIIAPDRLYGSEWSVASDRLGCPGEPVTSYVGSTTFFEHGIMYSLPTGEIYTIVPGGVTDGRYWYAPSPPLDQGWEILPPPGLLAPSGVFGAVWRAIEPARQAVGYAQTDPQPVSLSLQRFDHGALLFDGSAGQVFALVGTTGGQIGDGAALGPFASGVRP